MGSPLGPLLANVFMCHIENQLEQNNVIPSFYRRYVDETLVTMPNTESATVFLQVLNSVNPSLSFTMELEHEGSIPFLGTVLTRCGGTLTTEVYRKPTETGQLLHFQRHVDSRYKKGLVNSMVNPCVPSIFHQRRLCKRMQQVTQHVFKAELSENIGRLHPTVYIILHFKDQRLAASVLKDNNSLGANIDVNVKPVFTSRKLSLTLSVKENKPPINTQCVGYLFQCDLRNANYVGFTAQRISEHRYSAIGKHLETQHGNNRTKTDRLFKVLRKCNSKFDCLV